MHSRTADGMTVADDLARGGAEEAAAAGSGGPPASSLPDHPANGAEGAVKSTVADPAGEARASLIKPRPGTESDLREACAIDLDGHKPEHPKAARVWQTGRRRRHLAERIAQLQQELDGQFADYVAAMRAERDAKRLGAAASLAARGVDLEQLLRLAEQGKLQGLMQE